jgi:5-methylthioadenosine/S-adenosylhomocysteine deaminase
MTTIYCAHWVIPIGNPPIENGAVAVEGPKIVAVGERAAVAARYSAADVRDFGESAILPGLINTHSHLELTAMRGYLENEEGDFFAWLRKLTTARLERMTPDDLYVSAAWGAVEAVRAGVTTLGDASESARTSMEALKAVGLRGIVYQEAFGPNPADAREKFEELSEKLLELRGLETELVRVGVSPHAPYTVSGPLLELIAQLALEKNLSLMMHAAESEAESSFMRDGTGPFAIGLARRGIEWRSPGISTIQYLARHQIMKTRPLLAHCITVDEADIATVKEAGAGIAHCPKSNAKFRHGRAPFAAFLNRGINVGLGSDSVASNNTCDILEEARFATLQARAGASQSEPMVTAEAALRAATSGGAAALGISGIGALVEGGAADIAVVGLSGAHQLPSYDPMTTLLFSSSGRDVLMTMVAGREVYRDDRVVTVDEDRLRGRMKEIAKKVQG